MRTDQTTIGKAAEIRGRGLHSGREVTLRFLPAGPGSGLSFRRMDLSGMPTIPATTDSLDGVQARHTVLGKKGATVETVEHVLAACMGVGVDNVEIEMDGSEAPGIDGSAAPFVALLRECGTVKQSAKRRRIRIRRPVHVETQNGSISALPNPGEGLTVSYTLEYDNPRLRRQNFTFRLERDDFGDVVAPARTFCLEEEVEFLRRAGFGKGADLTNTVVVDRNGGIIGNALRFPDEFVRHKILDLIGDLSLAGCALEAHITASRTGHAANHDLVRRILQESDAADPESVNVREIQRILPHRYPFLLVDRIETQAPEGRAVGWKMVTGTEEYFQGHFPGRPMMPGVLQVEAMAQVAGALLLRQREYEGKISVILSIDKVRFRRPVVPGDRLRITAEVEQVKKRTAQMWVQAAVEEQRVSEARFRFMLIDDEED